jgi:molybdate transport system substrate-binding protein
VTVQILSSMATRQVLAELAAAHEAATGQVVAVESVGGVDAAARVRAGEIVDGVVLAAGVIDELTGAGHLVAGSRRDVAASGVSLAVRAGAPHPDIATEAAVRRAVLAAPTVACSTGPSGTHLTRLFERWGIGSEIADQVVVPPPGVAVGSLLADGSAALGFQQLSELIDLPGIEVVGPLPPDIQTVTVFAAAVAATSARPGPTADFLAFLASPAAAGVKRANGMEPA